MLILYFSNFITLGLFLFIFFRVTETNIAHKTPEREKLQKNRKDFIKRPPRKVLTFKENIKEDEEEEEEETDERKGKTKANIPPPYDQYYDYEWFPKNVGFNTSTIVHALLSQMNPDEPMIFKDILDCFVDIHRSVFCSQ